MSRGWYFDWFGEDYLRLYPHRDLSEAEAQIAFLCRAVPIAAHHRVLDLACGEGRHLFALQHRGVWSCGIDLSELLLQRAGHLLRRLVASPRLVRGDMRRLPLRRGIDHVLSLFTSFGYFETEAEERAVLASVRAVLRPGGTLVLDVLNRPYVIEHLVGADRTERGGLEFIQRRRYDPQRRRVIKEITIREQRQERRYVESVRAYDRIELTALLERERFAVRAAYGEFDGRPQNDASPRLILVARNDAGT